MKKVTRSEIVAHAPFAGLGRVLAVKSLIVTSTSMFVECPSPIIVHPSTEPVLSHLYHSKCTHYSRALDLTSQSQHPQYRT